MEYKGPNIKNSNTLISKTIITMNSFNDNQGKSWVLRTDIYLLMTWSSCFQVTYSKYAAPLQGLLQAAGGYEATLTKGYLERFWQCEVAIKKNHKFNMQI